MSLALGAKQSKDYFLRLLVKKYYLRKLAVKYLFDCSLVPPEARMKLASMAAAFPRNASMTRITNRCIMTGRKGWVLRDFRLCRNKIKELGMRGDIPGLRKASW